MTVSETSLTFDKAANVLSKMHKPESVFVSAFSDGSPFFVVVDSDNRNLHVAILF